MNDYQLLVIGAGPGGYVAAIRGARLGLKTAVVEDRDVGGTCLNRGCIPTKALLHSAELFSEIKNSARFGVSAENVACDFAAVHARKEEVVGKLRGGVEQLFKANKIDLIRGKGTICAPNTVKISGEEQKTVTADNIVIATGSVPARPPIPGLDLDGVITSDELLMSTDHIYDSLIIIGGGVIGVEFASVYSALGCKVTVIEALDRLLPNMDKEISQNLAMILKKRGVSVNTSSKVSCVVKGENGLRVNYVSKDKECSAEGEAVLVAIGRRPNTAGLFGEGISLESERGRLIVNERYETSMSGVYAIGDVSSRIQLAHAASAQGSACVEMIAGHAPSINVSLVPGCIYTSPEIASVGLTADEAKEAGVNVKVGKFTMFSNGKTIISDGERGFIKIVSEEETGKVLGAQMMCERATDMISEITTAVANGLTVEQMLKAMRPHPTFNEAVTEALEDVNGMAIHLAPPRK